MAHAMMITIATKILDGNNNNYYDSIAPRCSSLTGLVEKDDDENNNNNNNGCELTILEMIMLNDFF